MWRKLDETVTDGNPKTHTHYHHRKHPTNDLSRRHLIKTEFSMKVKEAPFADTQTPGDVGG